MAPNLQFLQGYASAGMSGQLKEIFYPAAPSTTANNYPVRRLSTSNNYSFIFSIPPDFGALDSLYIVAASAAAAASGPNKNIDLFSSYGKLGESVTANTASNTTSLYTIPAAGEFFSIDISYLYPNIEANDFAGIRLVQNSVGGNVDYFGVVLRYLTA